MKFKFNTYLLTRSLLIGGLVSTIAACGSDNDEPIIILPPVTNTAPSINSTSVDTVEEGSAYSYTFTATDAEDDALTYSASTLPTWLSFDVATGALTGTPATADVGDHSVTLDVSDSNLSDSETFTITVSALPVVNTPPTITSEAVVTGTVGVAYSYELTATDVDNDDLDSSSITLPTWGDFDASTGILSGTPDVAGSYDAELMVSDGTDSANQAFTIVVAEASAMTVELVVFENAAQQEWAAWINDGGSTEVVTDDAQHDQATKFTLTGPSVAGFTARDVDGAVGGMPYDASAIASTGSITFELKMLKAPDAGTVDWKLKVEGTGASELSLSDSVEGHATPLLDTWQTYTFPISALTGLDPSKMDLFMVFPNYNDAAGAEFLLDNFKIINDTSDVVDPEPSPMVEELAVFKDAALPEWAAWINDGGSTEVVTDDAQHDQATKFTLTGPSVAGFTARDADGAVGGMPYDASAIASTGSIMFELKMLKAPDAGVVDWKLKVEGTGASELSLSDSVEGHATPLLDTWQTYTFPISALTGLDPSKMDLFMVFPNYNDAAGAEFLLDNFIIVSGGDTDNNPGDGEGAGPVVGITDIGDYGQVTNGGFETQNLDGWLAGGGVTVVADDMGTYLVKIVAAEAQNENIYQDRIGEGVYTAGETLTVSFDMKGTAGNGGVVSALLYSDDPTQVSKTEELLPLALNESWTTYTFDVIAGDPLDWGVSLRLAAVCGAVAGCEVTAYFDNISISSFVP